MFERSIRMTVEHGHANKRSDELSSVAYWYQSFPHRPLGRLRLRRLAPAGSRRLCGSGSAGGAWARRASDDELERVNPPTRIAVVSGDPG